MPIDTRYPPDSGGATAGLSDQPNPSVVVRPKEFSRNAHTAIIHKIGTHWTNLPQPKFKKFCRFVRDKAATFHFDLQVSWKDQPTTQREELKNAALEEFPELRACEDAWPLHVYWDMYVINRRQHMKKRQNASGKPMNSVARHRMNPYIGRPPPRRTQKIGPPQRKNMPGGTSRPSNNKASAFIPGSEATFPYKTCMIANVSPEACIHCGHQPAIPEDQNTSLKAFLKESDEIDLLQSFASAGILHDRHFRQLLSLDVSDRDYFVASLVPAVFSHFQATLIIYLLSRVQITDHVPGFIPPPSQSPTTILANKALKPRPIATDESWLSSLSSSVEAVLMFMDMENTCYQEITAEVSRMYDDAMPSLMLDQEHLDLWVNFKASVLEKYPILKQYEGGWPILVIVRRHLAQARKEGAPHNAETKQLLAPVERLKSEFHCRKTLPCQSHFFQKFDLVPNDMLRHFASLGMLELYPAVLLLGLKGYKDLIKMADFDEYTVDRMLDGAKEIFLTPFYRHLLKVALRKVAQI